jgi:membrane-bound lytic murein transglycosylase A
VRLATPPPLADDGDRAGLGAALGASLAYLRRLPQDRTLDFGPDRVPVGRMIAALESLAAFLDHAPSDEALAAEVARRFVVYRAPAPEGALFTGYYLPALAASLTPDARFRYPVRGRPGDLVTVAPADFPQAACREPIAGRVSGGRLTPYFTRAEIEAGAARDAPVLAWVDDPVALFFLQIQGSGTLVLADGTRLPVGYAATNGHPYVSVGTLLVESGRLPLEEASMQGIRRWIAAHPEERERVLHANPRYVFFRPLAGPAVGSLGVPVTAGRTIATDPALYPPGALAFIRLPGGHAGAGAMAAPGKVATAKDAAARGRAPDLTRLVLNQDAGGAIRGPGRVDLFFGAGPDAGEAAGRFKHRGELYFLAPREDAGG